MSKQHGQPTSPLRPGQRLLKYRQDLSKRDRHRLDGPGIYPDFQTSPCSPPDPSSLGGIQLGPVTLTKNSTDYVRLIVAAQVRTVWVEYRAERGTLYESGALIVNLDTTHDNPDVTRQSQHAKPGQGCGLTTITADVSLSVLRLVIAVDNSDASHDVSFWHRLRFIGT